MTRLSPCLLVAQTLVLLLATVRAFAVPAAPSPAAPTPPQQFAQLGDVKLENDTVIRDCAIGYRTLGTLNADRSNAIVFTTWHTGTSGDELSMLGPKGLFDPSPYYVVIIDAIGNGVSCSPSNSTKQHGTAFPTFTIRDMVEAEYRLLTEKLGLKHSHAIVGYSMGGMQAFQWMVSHPTFMDVAIPISGTPRQSSYDLLFWRTEEMAMLSDPGYADGQYRRNPQLALFHLIFTMNASAPAYRVAGTTPAAFETFFQKTAFEPDPDAADANDSRWQIRAILSQDVGERTGAAPEDTNRSLELAAKKVRARALIIVALQDHIANPTAALDFAKRIHADTVALESNCGHFAAATCETDTIRPAIERALRAQR